MGSWEQRGRSKAWGGAGGDAASPTVFSVLPTTNTPLRLSRLLCF